MVRSSEEHLREPGSDRARRLPPLLLTRQRDGSLATPMRSARVRNLARGVAEGYLALRESLGFPLLEQG